MASLPLKTLVGKLNPVCKRALESAAGLCLSRTNYSVEIEHFLLKMIEANDSDIPRIFKQYDVETGAAVRELTKALDKLKTGNSRAPELSVDILDWLREGWVVTSLNCQSFKVRTGYLVAALLANATLSRRLLDACPSFAKIPAEQFVKDAPTLLKGMNEDQYDVSDSPAAGPGATGGSPGAVANSKTPALDQYTTNLTEQARQGKIDPVIGRDFEIRQVIDILTRRRQNNPILTGEAGVGKTAVVEGFALQIVAGDVPPPLKNVVLRTLDLGLLQAGAGVKGEFENRLKTVIQEVKSSPTPIILFIDEAHTMIGAGGQAGQGDAANLLKPALARGELRTIAATTWLEYKKYFEGDPALKRRFQVVKVDEPDIAKAIAMMRGIAATMEKHHKVRILDEAVEEAVKLSHRYITDRQLPDKSVSLLDTACARVALSQTSIPPAIQDARRDVERIDVELTALDRETSHGVDHKQRAADLNEKKTAIAANLAALEKRWEEEKKLAEQVQALAAKLDAHRVAKADAKERLTGDQELETRTELNKAEKMLMEVQGEDPLVLPVVGGQAIAAVVSGWTGIPLGKMVRNEIQAVLSLKDRMAERVIGQDHGLEAIAQRIRTSRANLTDPRRPIGVFMLVGPSGVGKTETAMSLADILYGGDRNMVIINMSEYKESHKISNLTGSAKGLVGYGEPGALTDPVRRKPYCIVLLDEVEKAHTDVQELFYQVFDKGMLQDSSGNDINFKNTIIILTSNVGTDTIMKLCADPDTKPDAETLAQALRPDLLKSFKPALLGRITIVPYFPLDDKMLQNITKLQLKKIGDRLKENHRADFTYDDSLVTTITSRCKEVESGARNVDHILTGTMLPEMASEILNRTVEGTAITSVHVAGSPDGKFIYTIN
ncbi:MAG: type VI secretion system ATPase TssH [Planctomycetes bacterium]|nr:type VI secretion system ATPase TssH [Planctomycetota bacterium]